MTLAGEIILVARTHRTREANRQEARARIAALIAKAHERPVRRIKTKPSKSAKAKRIDTKTARGTVKRGRGKVTDF